MQLNPFNKLGIDIKKRGDYIVNEWISNSMLTANNVESGKKGTNIY
jgi:hypothetical protein